MSTHENCDDLLIDFNNVNGSDDIPNANQFQHDTVIQTELTSSHDEQKSRSMAFLCSTQPLYKLLQKSESIEVEDNNPFDHLDKQAGLLDDPFELVENAATVSSELITENRTVEIETGTLISIDSPMYVKVSPQINIRPEKICDTPKVCSISSDEMSGVFKETQLEDSVQKTSQKQWLGSESVPKKSSASPTSGRSKSKNTSLSLLKYSFSNSRIDLAGENASLGEESRCEDDTIQKKHPYGVRRDSTTDDSFDDIWATKPNLIDSQTDIDIDSDIDNDIANLNIPMLNISMPGLKTVEHEDSKAVNQESQETVDTKSAAQRNGILEKLASYKQKIPQSPAISIDPKVNQIHNQTVDIKSRETCDGNNDEPVTPKSQFSSVVLPQSLPDNPSSLIENLMRMVNQCDDKSEQITAKHLLDDLSSILSKSTKNEKNDITKQPIEGRLPIFNQLKRQGTFSIEKNDCNDDTGESNVSDVNDSNEYRNIDMKDSVMDAGLSKVMEHIHNAFGSHQNINVLQTNEQPRTGFSTSGNPTYIVVMSQPVVDLNEETTGQRPHRSRSQSLTFKEKPSGAYRAIQQKIDQSNAQASVVATPIKRPILQRRSSFGAITRKPPNADIEAPTKVLNPNEKSDAQKVIRRRSLQCSAVKQEATEAIQPKPSNTIIRRRSFQGSSGVRSPSPKAKSTGQLSRINTTGTLTRRKSFATDLSKDSPQKLKSSYGIMKKPPAPAAARNLKIRVSQGANGRSSAPLRAVVPMKQVASLLLINETVSPVEDKRTNALITSTPRSIPSSSPAKSKKGKSIFSNGAHRFKIVSDDFQLFILAPLIGPSAESPIQNFKDMSHVAITPPKSGTKTTNDNVTHRRRTLSDYRTTVNSSVVVDSHSGVKAVSSIKNATKTLATGLSKFTARRMVSTT